MSQVLTVIFLALSTGVFGQNLSKFFYSNCLKECINDSSKITEIISVDDLTIIRVKTYAPCNGNLAGGVEQKNDTVNLKFWTRPIIVKGKDGKLGELLEISDCNCMFDFNYEIKGLKIFKPNLIVINGLTLRQIDRKNIPEELIIQMDSVR